MNQQRTEEDVDTNKDLIDDMVCASTRELFATFGVELESTSSAGQPGEFVAVIGFSAENMRGALGLTLRGDLVATSLTRTGDAKGWMVKPFNATQLVAVVQKLAA
jgi:hypothetical protein